MKILERKGVAIFLGFLMPPLLYYVLFFLFVVFGRVVGDALPLVEPGSTLTYLQVSLLIFSPVFILNLVLIFRFWKRKRFLSYGLLLGFLPVIFLALQLADSTS